MTVTFSKAFKKDLLKLKDASLKLKIKKTVLQLESQSSLEKISNCKRLKGHPSAYRIRIGKYRLGFYFKESQVQLARFIKREDIYKLFP